MLHRRDALQPSAGGDASQFKIAGGPERSGAARADVALGLPWTVVFETVDVANNVFLVESPDAFMILGW